MINVWRTRSVSHISVVAFQPNHEERALMMAYGWRYTRWDLVHAGLQCRDPTLTAAVAMIYDKEQNKNYSSPVVKRLQVTAASYLYPICLVYRAHINPDCKCQPFAESEEKTRMQIHNAMPQSQGSLGRGWDTNREKGLEEAPNFPFSTHP